MVIRNYDIYNPKVESTNMVFLSDVHGDNTKLELIKDILKKIRVSTILIGGDLIDSSDDERNDHLIELIKELSYISDIIISLGNHDIPYDEYKEVDEVPEKDLSFLKEISTIKNVYIPDIPIQNPTFSTYSLDNNIDISTINFPITYYREGEKKEYFLKMIDILKDLSNDISRYNILLCHSPNNFLNIKEYCEYIKRYNLILSGHIHGGMVPQFLRKIFNDHGLAGPYATYFPKYAYGLKKLGDNTTILTTGGVTKISSTSKLSILSGKLYTPEIEILHFNSGSEKIKVYKQKR